MPARRPICFLICPIGDHRSEIRERSLKFLSLIVQPAMDEHGFEVVHFLEPDHQTDAGSIRERMSQYLKTADLCIVDLTGNNNNVLFEYGLRRGTGLPVLPFQQDGNKLSYDVDDFPVSTYDLGNPQEAIQEIARFFGRSGRVEGSQLSLARERYTQTAEICDYIRRNDPRRIDILHFSLRALGPPFFESLWACSDLTLRLVLLHPSYAKRYALKTRHSDDVLWAERQVRGTLDAARLYRRAPYTIGLWYHRHEPSAAALIIDDSIVQLGWYFRDPLPEAAGKSLVVMGHNKPGILAMGAAARTLLPCVREHMDSVWGNAELADPEWAVAGPRRSELLAEWEALRNQPLPPV